MNKNLLFWKLIWKLSAEYLPEKLRKEIRWHITHEDEKRFWLNIPEEEFQAQAKGYRNLAEQILERLQARLKCGGNFKALQIGCAVEDAIFYFPYGQLHAIDPLANFYKANLKRSNKANIDYRRVSGKKVPFPNSYFDLIICQNVIDHVMDSNRVLNEIKE